MADSRAMWFRVVLMIGLVCGPATAKAQTWTACYDAASDSLTADGHRAVRAAAVAHLNDPEPASRSGWRGVQLQRFPALEAAPGDWRAAFRITIELRRLGVSPGKIQSLTDVQYEPLVSGRDTCLELSLASVPVRSWHYSAVYFLPDSADLTDVGRLSLESAVADYARDRKLVVVNGYDDTAGTIASSLAISERRTTSVAEALVRLGVLWADIEQHSWGERSLARPTPDGAAEPLNRRVVIDLFTRPEPAR